MASKSNPGKTIKGNNNLKSAPVNKNDNKGKASQLPVRQTLIDRLDKAVEPRLNLIFYISLFLTVLCGAYLFDVKISTGGDDSHYIEMANDFIKGRTFPSWHGPLYSIFLSMPMLIFGVNVVLLKILSFIFIIAHLFLFYITFKKHVSPTIFAIILLIISVNSSILYFGSQTYSEAMYMFLQALCVFLFINIYMALASGLSFPIKLQIYHFIILGFFVFLASLTRNIGIVGLLAIITFLVLERKLVPAFIMAAGYALFFLPFKIYKNIVWHTGRAGGELSEILLKNQYNRAEGSENFSGMVVRFIENCNSYLSKHFLIGLGLRNPASTDKSGFITFLIVALFLITFIISFRRSKIMLFITIYLGASMAATFIALQQQWDQMRMVIIYVPMLLLVLSWGMLEISKRKNYGFLQIVLLTLLVIIFFKSFGQTGDKMKVNQKILSKNIKGNQLYGFTPDWQNFLLMSAWAGKNMPDTSVIASRKPSMSFIYSKGRDFYGIYRFPTEEPDKLISELRKRTSDLIAIPNVQFTNTIPANVQMAFKSAAVAYVADGAYIYGVYDLKDQVRDILMQEAGKYKLTSLTTDTLITILNHSTQSKFAVSPDTLINALLKNKVDYVIVANLRANPNVNNGNIINNIQRYLYFIELKYPGILTMVYQMGDTNDEPAWLYKINYNYYGMKKPK